MYSTCLFCNRTLGRNEAIEHFQVGRRLAYDAAKGRLWVVCEFCKRWNLTPLEERWEAIEESERLFRGSPLRVSTDNIGLAQLRSGLDLIRVGAPSRAELAAWRYGDQFGRRRRKYMAVAAAGIGVVGTSELLGILTPFRLVSTTVVAGSTFAAAAVSWSLVARMATDTIIHRLFVRDDAGGLLPLTNMNMRSAALVPTGPHAGCDLTLPYRTLRPAGVVLKTLGIRSATSPAPRSAILTGANAQRALTKMLPYLNRAGGSERRIADAVDVIGASSNIEQLLRTASLNTEAKKTHYKIRDGESNIAALPARFRLALEMALHEDDERRAMEGELRQLEDRWRDAEAIAAIADSLVTSPDVDVALGALRDRPLDHIQKL